MRRLLLLLALIPTSVEVAQTAMCVKLPTIVKADPAQEKCLAVTVYGEARGEPTLGQIAVAYTVVNRAIRSSKSLCNIVLAQHQYSIFNNNPKLRAIAISLHLIPEQKNIIDQKSWEQAVKVAQMVSRNYVEDPTGGATHYIADKVMKSKGYHYPKWSKEFKMVKEIENHKFYKAE